MSGLLGKMIPAEFSRGQGRGKKLEQPSGAQTAMVTGMQIKLPRMANIVQRTAQVEAHQSAPGLVRRQHKPLQTNHINASLVTRSQRMR